MVEEMREILNELKGIRIDINFIKQNMPDKDMFLDAEEKELLKESLQNEKEGKLLSALSLRKSLEL
jgi:hypothetical protein